MGNKQGRRREKDESSGSEEEFPPEELKKQLKEARDTHRKDIKKAVKSVEASTKTPAKPTQKPSAAPAASTATATATTAVAAADKGVTAAAADARIIRSPVAAVEGKDKGSDEDDDSDGGDDDDDDDSNTPVIRRYRNPSYALRKHEAAADQTMNDFDDLRDLIDREQAKLESIQSSTPSSDRSPPTSPLAGRVSSPTSIPLSVTSAAAVVEGLLMHNRMPSMTPMRGDGGEHDMSFDSPPPQMVSSEEGDSYPAARGRTRSFFDSVVPSSETTKAAAAAAAATSTTVIGTATIAAAITRAPVAKEETATTTTTTAGDSIAVSETKVIPEEEVKKVSLIGEGSFKRVFRAQWKDQPVAVLELIARGPAPGPELMSFEKECEQILRLDHPNVVRLFGKIRPDPSAPRTMIVAPNIVIPLPAPPLAFVAELCETGSLYDMLHVSPHPLEAKFAWKWARELARGVSYLHGLRPPIVHQDLKSPNLLLTWDNVLKIADFGFAAVQQNATGLSSRHRGYGTFAWMSPEQFEDDQPKFKITAQCDIYAIGCILIELFARAMPWAGCSQVKIYKNVCLRRKKPPELAMVTSSSIRALADACLSFVPSHRPTAAQLLVAIEQAGKEAFAMLERDAAAATAPPPRSA